MAVKSVNKKVRRSIVVATMTTIFSLATLFVGTYAWFATSTSVTTTGMQVTVVSSGSCDMEEVNVIKFDYDIDRIADTWSYDYLNPQDGTVSEYAYSKRDGENSFGYYAGKDTYYKWSGSAWVKQNSKPAEGQNKGYVNAYNLLPVSGNNVGDYRLVVDDEYPMYFVWDSSASDWIVSSEQPSGSQIGATLATFGDLPASPSSEGYYVVTRAYWHKIEAMNVYDPVDSVIRHSTLKDLNCNAIYEASFKTSDYHYLDLDLVASTCDVDVNPANNEKLLSDFIDIDIFFESDLLDSNPLFTVADDPDTHWVNEADDLPYYPSYKFEKLEKYYEWNGSAWTQTSNSGTSRGTGIDRGTTNYIRNLPTVSGSPSDGDYYEVETNDIYYQWNGTDWDKTGNQPGSGDSKGIVESESELPASGMTLNDYYLVKNCDQSVYYKWSDSAWVISDAVPGSGTSKGAIDDISFLPVTSGDYFKVLKGTASVLTNLEKTYYKISYLASLIPENGHKHFYGARPQDKVSEIHIVDNARKTITFEQGVAQKFYVNVNYAPSKADPYYSQISLKSIKALYDYKFEFNFSNGVSF